MAALGLVAIACGRIGYETVDGGGDAGDPLAGLSDEFGGALDPRWQSSNPTYMSASASGGSVILTPLMNRQWFMNDQGGLIWVPVTGDFVATAQLTVAAASGGAPVGPGYELSGILARDPRSETGPQDNCQVSLGAVDAAPSKESKSTDNDVSDYTTEPFAVRGQVRLCRIGSAFHTFHSPYGGGGWIAHRTFDRPDLAATLDVGLFATENSVPVDIVATVEWIHFATPHGVADCTSSP